eukprot:TRINITY_DN11213_c0_g1_i1.p1 TRINITY_DN11213_c0_g1~~TRINITY_DN11213_c0_g1_i1.p1  ORF type:complete len:300 (-),score=63.56 TRINITY_DN11213_c0_g1_i1:258-1124(-)
MAIHQSAVFVLLCASIAASLSPKEPIARIAPNLGGVPSECTHVVDSGAHLFEKGDSLFLETATGAVSEIPKCQAPLTKPPGHGVAWKAWTQFEQSASSAVTSLTGKWIVPPTPTTTNSGQTLFFWNGVEPADNTAVLQPVLQWGPSAGGGGNYWAVASWYVSAAHGSIVTKLITASPGDVIYGGLTASSNGTWLVTGVNMNTNASASFTYQPKDGNYAYAYQVLEAYNIAKCSDYPSTGTENFFNINLELDGKAVTPKWEAKTQSPTTCGERAKVFNATDVSIDFKTQ